jgi:hypothetical protein
MITRAQMRRQLRAKGGIMNVAPREKFGLGSKIKDRFRKLIPNEIANIAVKAAPFVAMIPGYGPAAAGLMRGIGRFDQRGSISDAVKQGLGTYAGGKVFDAGMRGVGLRDKGASGIREFFNQDTTQKGKALFQKDTVNPFEETAKAGNKVATKPREGLEVVQKGVDFVKEKIPMLENLPDDVAQKLLVGSVTSGASALYSYFAGEFEPQQPGESMEEYMARRNQRVKQQMRGYMDSYYTPLRNPQYAAMSDEEKNNYIDSIVGQGMATGGRVGLMGGTMPMGEPRVNQGGITELDYRAKGGFVPVGIKEKADDVPAMLSKNEFVFTADAVRGAGNGSVEKGAQKMYDTMKNLERRVT